MQYVTLPSHGDTAIGRHGDKIAITSIASRFFWTWTTAADAGIYPLRILYVWDRRPLGAAPAITDIVDAGNTIGSYQIEDPAVRGRFQVLLDRTYVGSTDRSTVYDKFYFNRHRLISQLTGTGGAITDVQTGALFICGICSSGKTGNVNSAVDVMLRFEDL